MSFPGVESVELLDLSSFGQLSDLTTLLDAADDAIRRAFLSAIADTRALASLEEIAVLIEAGRIGEAVILVDNVVPPLMDEITAAYTAAGANAAVGLTRDLNRFISFDQLNARSVAYLQATRLDLVRSLQNDTRIVLQQVLSDGFRRGLAPVAIAREARASIGLTPLQQEIIENYRANLEARSSRALTRELRDRRFDRTVARAIRTDTPLRAAQIDRMVDRYRERWIKHRAETIALTEAQRAIHTGDEELWMQAADRAEIDPNDVVGIWHWSHVSRTSHAAMDLQERPLGQPFLSGDGNLLRFPGDGPASEAIRCRCVVARGLRTEA